MGLFGIVTVYNLICLMLVVLHKPDEADILENDKLNETASMDGPLTANSDTGSNLPPEKGKINEHSENKDSTEQPTTTNSPLQETRGGRRHHKWNYDKRRFWPHVYWNMYTVDYRFFAFYWVSEG